MLFFAERRASVCLLHHFDLKFILKLKPKIKIFLILRNFGLVGRCFNEHVILFYFISSGHLKTN